MMKKWKKRGLIGIGVLVVTGVVWSAAFKAVDVDTVPVEKTNVTATVLEKGKVVSEGTVDIFSEVQGKVTEVYVNEGDKVQEGQLLASIDAADIEAQIGRLEGELRAIEGTGSQGGSNQVMQMEAALEQARVSYDLAKSAYDRTVQLYNEGAVTKAELDQAKAAMESAKESVSQASAALSAAKKQYQGQKQGITSQLNYLYKQKKKAGITADRDGTIFTKKVKQGDYVTPGTMLFTLGGGGPKKIEAYVNSKDMAYVRQGDEVTVSVKLPGRDAGLTGIISGIAPAAEERMSSLGIIEDTIKVTVKLKKEPKGIPLTPGMTVDVTVVTRQARSVPAVPKEAVFKDRGKEYVWEVKKGSASLVQVETGVEGDDLVEIKKGLAVGSTVILNPHLNELKEGIRVK